MSEKSPVSMGFMIWSHLYNILEIIKLEKDQCSGYGNKEAACGGSLCWWYSSISWL